MKRASLLFIFISLITELAFPQNVTDSLVLFSDLKYQSEFEKTAFLNYVNQKKDTFNLFLAIDKDMLPQEAKKNYITYRNVFKELKALKLDSKPLNKKIKISYSTVHNNFLQKYSEREYFPAMFRNGTYNCVSASMLYSLVFDQLKIPYRVMVSSNHVYLVADPGPNSIVIETTNPGFEKSVFTGDFKKQYVNYLRESKMVSESEYKNKSVEELFEAKFSEVKEADFINLAGFQYYNKAIAMLQDNKNKEALELCQKAYFFYPDQRVKILLYAALLLQIEKSNFEKIADIDYLAQLSRFENTEQNTIDGIFNNVIAHHLQYTDKEAFCDSLFQRLSPQIANKTTREEISFSYYMLMSYRFQNSNKVEYYVGNALKIKGNHQNANIILETFIRKKLNAVNGSYAILDSVQKLKTKYNYEHILPVLSEYEMIACLKLAGDLYYANNLKSGEKYLQQFESICKLPIEKQVLAYWIEKTYRSIAVHCFYSNNVNLRNKVKGIKAKGLEYLPNSELLKSAFN